MEEKYKIKTSLILSFLCLNISALIFLNRMKKKVVTSIYLSKSIDKTLSLIFI